MKITINTDVLKNYNLSLGQFIVLLIGYYNLGCQKIYSDLVNRGLVEKDLFKGFPPVLSDNTKNLVAKIIVGSDDKVVQSGIDFDTIANKLQLCYPDGNKSGTTYPWRGSVEEIAQKLRTLVVKYNFTFTEEEAVVATLNYVSSFKEPYTTMSLLKYFILKTMKGEEGKLEISSMFMTIIENNRRANENNN